MKKLKLQIDELAVESFSTRAPEPREGTVFGHSHFPCDTWDDQTCRYFNTCGGGPTCDGFDSCNPNCWPQGPIDHKTTDPTTNWTQVYC